MLTQDDIYPTRGEQERLTERKDPILYGWDHSPKAMSEAQLLHYERHGFVIIPEVFSLAEVACISGRLTPLRQRNNLEKRDYWRQNVPPGECESLFCPERGDTLFGDLSRESRILERVMQILGSSVYLHRSRIHVEDGVNATAYPWHSEFETWHAEDGVPRMRGAEAWVMLSESAPGNGAMQVLAKSHHIYAACQGDGGRAIPGDGSSMRGLARPSFETLTRLRYFGELMEVHGKPGTLVISDCNLMYGSSGSAGSRARMTAMFSYNSVENMPSERPFACKDFRPAPLVSSDRTPLEAHTCRFDRGYESGTARVAAKRGARTPSGPSGRARTMNGRSGGFPRRDDRGRSESSRLGA